MCANVQCRFDPIRDSIGVDFVFYVHVLDEKCKIDPGFFPDEIRNLNLGSVICAKVRHRDRTRVQSPDGSIRDLGSIWDLESGIESFHK